MIRDRRNEDIDRLCEVLIQLPDHAGALDGCLPEDWLHMPSAEMSWVFDQAPTNVTPTRNVVRHVLSYRPTDAQWADDVAARVDRRSGEVRVIGRLFVKPSKHTENIAWYLLKEAVKYVETRGHLAVLDPADLAFVPPALPRRLGFAESRTEDGTTHALVRTS